MTSPINKFEAIGIFGSIAVMVAALLLLRTEFGTQSNVASVTEVKQAGVVVVDPDEQNPDAALANALVANATIGGDLKRLVVNEVTAGTGAPAGEGDTVVVHYIGRTSEGVQFDSSYDRGTPFSFTLGEGKVIPGWEAGIEGMKVGGERILIVPPEQGYGNRQVGPIPANSILVFKVELLNIQ